MLLLPCISLSMQQNHARDFNHRQPGCSICSVQLDNGRSVMHLQEKVGIRSHHCSVIATDIKHKVDEEVADAGGPSTSRKSRRVTLCVEGNISAGKSTFLNWVAQGHPELDGMLEVGPLTETSSWAETNINSCAVASRPAAHQH